LPTQPNGSNKPQTRSRKRLLQTPGGRGRATAGQTSRSTVWPCHTSLPTLMSWSKMARPRVRKEGEESEGHDARPDVGIYAILQTGEKRLGLSRRSTRPAEQTVKWRMKCLGGYKLSSRKRKPVIGAANLQRSDWETWSHHLNPFRGSSTSQGVAVWPGHGQRCLGFPSSIPCPAWLIWRASTVDRSALIQAALRRPR
jgi:hypothetical protein